MDLPTLLVGAQLQKMREMCRLELLLRRKLRASRERVHDAATVLCTLAAKTGSRSS